MLSRLFMFLIMSMYLTGCAPSINQERILDSITQKRGIDSEGPQLTCRRLTNEEFQEIFQKDLLPVQAIYRLEIENFKPGNQYRLYSVDLKKRITPMGEFTVDDQAQLISMDLFDPMNPYLTKKIMFNDFFLNGEEISYVLVAKDDSEYIAASIAPNPIEISWEDGACVSIVSLHENMEIFLAKAKNFIPNEKISIVSVSNNESLPLEILATPNGTWDSFFLPATIGHDSGCCKLIIKREHADEASTLEFKWGKAAHNDAEERMFLFRQKKPPFDSL